MEAEQVQTEQAKLMAAHQAARTELMRLIDNPEKDLPIDAYRANLRRAQQDVARTRKAMLTAGTW